MALSATRLHALLLVQTTIRTVLCAIVAAAQVGSPARTVMSLALAPVQELMDSLPRTLHLLLHRMGQQAPALICPVVLQSIQVDVHAAPCHAMLVSAMRSQLLQNQHLSVSRGQVITV